MNRNESNIVDYCMNFARRGYVAASFDYRTGYPDCCGNTDSLPVPCMYKGDYRHYEKAVYQAQQDASAAIRYLKSRAQTLGIDTTKIVMAGSSSGATLALHTTYAQEFELPPDLITEFGSLKRFGEQGFSDQVSAAVSLWGSIKNTDWLTQRNNGQVENTPLLMFHGTCDGTYRYSEGIYQCFLNPDTTIYKVFGPASIRNTIETDNLPICFETHTGCGFAHGMQRKCKGNANVADGHINKVIYYIMNETAEFIYNNVLECSPGCQVENGYLLKPCYCG